jgi:hypothetical protein
VLAGVRGRIVDGPSAAGMLTIELREPRADLPAALQTLRASSVVLLAEPAN